MATSITGLGVSGLSSGLDTSGIITKLMAIEQGPQAALKSKLSAASQFRTALQAVNTQVVGIATSATAAARTNALAGYTATSDTTGVSAKASSTATPGTLDFTVDALATAQVSVSAAMSSWPDTSSARPSITITSAGVTKTVEAASSNLEDVAAAVNASGTGVTATKVATGQKDADGNAMFRLQFRGATGAANTFTVAQGTDSSNPLPVTQRSAAADAQITLFGDTPVTSATNTFTSLMTGVDVTVSAPTVGASATVTVAADPTAATTAAQGLTSALTMLFSGLKDAMAITTSSSSTGTTTSTRGGIFTGDSAVRALKDGLLAAATGAVTLTGSAEQISPSSIGITITKDGTLTFDQAKFTAAMTSDATKTTAVFQAIAARVEKEAKAVSDSASGTLTQRITNQQGTESRMTTEIGNWDTRLTVIQAQYTKQFNALETALNALSSQASYLTSQISGLTTNYQQTS